MINLTSYLIESRAKDLTGSEVVSYELRNITFHIDEPRVYKKDVPDNAPEEEKVELWFREEEEVQLFVVKTENGLQSLYDPAIEVWHNIPESYYVLGEVMNIFYDINGGKYRWIKVMEHFYSTVPEIYLNMSLMKRIGECFFNVKCKAVPLQMTFKGSNPDGDIVEEVIGYYADEEDGSQHLFAAFFMHDRVMQTLGDFSKFKSVKLSENEIYEKVDSTFSFPKGFEPHVIDFNKVPQLPKIPVIVDSKKIEIPKWITDSCCVHIMMEFFGLYGQQFNVYPAAAVLGSAEHKCVVWKAMRMDNRVVDYMVIKEKQPRLSHTPGCINEHATLMGDGEVFTSFVAFKFYNEQLIIG